MKPKTFTTSASSLCCILSYTNISHFSFYTSAVLRMTIEFPLSAEKFPEAIKCGFQLTIYIYTFNMHLTIYSYISSCTVAM